MAILRLLTNVLHCQFHIFQGPFYRSNLNHCFVWEKRFFFCSTQNVRIFYSFGGQSYYIRISVGKFSDNYTKAKEYKTESKLEIQSTKSEPNRTEHKAKMLWFYECVINVQNPTKQKQKTNCLRPRYCKHRLKTEIMNKICVVYKRHILNCSFFFCVYVKERVRDCVSFCECTWVSEWFAIRVLLSRFISTVYLALKKIW